MCGIAGFLHKDRDQPVDQSVLREMTQALRHRGPDDAGYFVGRGIALGHRRLAIIDPKCGRQPMQSVDGRYTIAFNGEIYNYPELRAELRDAGFEFQTNSDTEVLLNSYIRWGLEMFPRLNGVWALAVWDSSEEQLLLARDRIGEKPLYYADSDTTLVFASEPKSILKLRKSTTPELRTLNLYLSLGYIPGRQSFFAGMNRVMPGEYLLAQGKRLTRGRYWTLPIVGDREMRRDRGRVSGEFSTLIDDAVRIRMRSDVPFGAFLSGGLDSTSIVTIMARDSATPVSTYTIGFEDSRDDERSLARLVADRTGSKYHEMLVSRDVALNSVRTIVDMFDEPFGDSSAAAVGIVSGLASRHVKMVLTGDGGDETLSGYSAYRVERLLGMMGMLPQFILDATLFTGQALIGSLAGTRPGLRRLQRQLASARLPFSQRLAAKAAWADQRTLHALFPGLLRESITPSDYIEESLRHVQHLDAFYQLMHFHFGTSLPDDMLTKVDRMSMAHSLEVRAPFLDHRLIELMAGVAKTVKMRRLEAKTVLRETVGRQLPQELLRARKRGFSMPMDAWFRNPSHLEALCDLAGKSQLPMDLEVLHRIASEHRTGNADYGGFLWILMVLLVWFDAFQ